MTKKNNEGLVWLYAFVGFLAGLVIGWMLWGRTGIVKAHNSNGEWGKWVNTSDCQQLECGSAKGILTQTRTCKYDNGSNECKPEKWECPTNPNDYTSTDSSKDCKVYKDHPTHAWRYADKVMTQKADTETQEISCEVAEPKECEPEVTPSPEPTPMPNPINYNVGAPICNDGGTPKFAPTITKMWRDGKGNVDMTWTTTDVNNYVVYFGYSGKELNWNTGRISGQGITLHDTPNVLLDGIVCALSTCGAENCSARFIDP